MRIINCNIYTPVGYKAVKGPAMGELRHIPNGVIEINEGMITYAGPRGNVNRKDCDIDAEGRAVLPGFVDSHTHLIFGGYRPDEFTWRMRGDSYMSIMERGGGIANTMKATREASTEELEAKALKYINRMIKMGVTMVEAKTGYGLDKDTEIRQLEIIKKLDHIYPRIIDIIPTYLGGHALPPEFAGEPDKYIQWMIDEMLPVIKKRMLAINCDIFCEKGVFTVEQSRRLLKAAQHFKLNAKIHADEIVTTGGAELAAEIGALSADHLLHISDKGISDLAASNTVATLLPLTAFTLREPYAPARKMIDAGCAVALASDLNPGSCLSGSIPLIFALACIYMGLSVEEAITAITLNGAAAVDMSYIAGSIEEGKFGDLVILDSDNINVLPYYTGMNSVKMTIKRGRVVAVNE